MSTEHRRFNSAGILLREKLLNVEHATKTFTETLNKYQRSQIICDLRQMVSKLLAAALQIIHIVGGSLAGILRAGHDLVSGLAIKDVIDYVMSTTVPYANDGMQSFRHRLLSSP